MLKYFWILLRATIFDMSLEVGMIS